MKRFIVIVFIWLMCVGYGQVTDTDGNTYKTVKIGNQVWMTENLNVIHFRNGDPISEARSDEEWDKAHKNNKPACCYYDNDPAKGEKYSKLYNWYSVNDPRGLAPKGWHIPTDKDWTVLTDYLGGNDVAGKKMKSTSGWSNNGNGTNESGFNGLSGGLRNANGSFYDIGGGGYWWSALEDGTNDAWGRGLYSDYGNVFRSDNIRMDGLYVYLTT